MSATASLERIGVGIKTAHYGHCVSFLRPARQQAAKPLTVTENQAGYQALEDRVYQLHQQHPQAHFHVRIDAARQYAEQKTSITGISQRRNPCRAGASPDYERHQPEESD